MSSTRSTAAVLSRDPSDVVSSQQAADLCGVDRRTVLRWVERGLLPSHRPPGGRHRILVGDLRQFMREHGMPMPRALHETPRIAVADDDPRIVSVLSQMITRRLQRAEVRTASDGFGAGVLVGAFRPHLLFLDIVMPGVDGVQVCRAIHASSSLSETAIVVISGNLTGRLEDELLALGVKRCLAKPFHMEKIIEVLDELVPEHAP